MTNLYVPMSENEVMEKLEHSMEQAKQGKYKSSDDVILNLKEKYGL